MYKIAKKKIAKPHLQSKQEIQNNQHPIGSLVFWNENEFDDNQLVVLIAKFGMEPLKVVGIGNDLEVKEKNGEKVFYCTAIWTIFQCSNGTVEKTLPSNLKSLNDFDQSVRS